MEILSTNGAQRFGLSPTRIYDPVTGRYLQQDPMFKNGPKLIGGSNLYEYVGNCPVSKVDPLGLQEMSHDVPRAIWDPNAANPIKFSKEAQEVFDETRFAEGHSGWSKLHSQYNKAVRDEAIDWLEKNGINAEAMTAEQAQAFLAFIRDPEQANPVIKNFLDTIYGRGGQAGFASIKALLGTLGVILTVQALGDIIGGGWDHIDCTKVFETANDDASFCVYECKIMQAQGFWGLSGMKHVGDMIYTVEVPNTCKGCHRHPGKPTKGCAGMKCLDKMTQTLYNLQSEANQDRVKDLGIKENFYKVQSPFGGGFSGGGGATGSWGD